MAETWQKWWNSFSWKLAEISADSFKCKHFRSYTRNKLFSWGPIGPQNHFHSRCHTWGAQEIMKLAGEVEWSLLRVCKQLLSHIYHHKEEIFSNFNHSRLARQKVSLSYIYLSSTSHTNSASVECLWLINDDTTITYVHNIPFFVHFLLIR